MSGGKIGADCIGFALTEVAIALVAAGGAAALTAVREADELSKLIRESEKQLKGRQEALRAEGERQCRVFEQHLAAEVAALSASLERVTGKKITAGLAGETVYESYLRLAQIQTTAPSVKADPSRRPANPVQMKRVFEEAVAIAGELLPYEWPERYRVAAALAEAKKVMGDKTMVQHKRVEALTRIRNDLRNTRKRHLSQINRVESLRRQYLAELATARVLYAVTNEQFVEDDFRFAQGEAQIAHLREINAAQRQKLDAIYENPTGGMAPEERQQAVRDVSDRIAAVMRACGNKLVGNSVSPEAITRFYRYGGAFLRCCVAENGTVVMEVVGDSCGDRNVETVVGEMERFKNEFVAIQKAMEERGIGFAKYGEYAPCAESVEFFNVREEHKPVQQEIVAGQVLYHEEM